MVGAGLSKPAGAAGPTKDVVGATVKPPVTGAAVTPLTVAAPTHP